MVRGQANTQKVWINSATGASPQSACLVGLSLCRLLQDRADRTGVTLSTRTYPYSPSIPFLLLASEPHLKFHERAHTCMSWLC